MPVIFRSHTNTSEHNLNHIMNTDRLFVEKREPYRVEAESLRKELNSNLGLDIRSLRLLCVYDLFGFTPELVERASYGVFGEKASPTPT